MIASAGRARVWAGAKKLGVASILSRDGVSGAVAERRTCLVVERLVDPVAGRGVRWWAVVEQRACRSVDGRRFGASRSAIFGRAVPPSLPLQQFHWTGVLFSLTLSVFFLDLVLRNSPRLLALLEQTAKVRRLAVLEQSADLLLVVDE